jgi:4-amino-4-deoxy-L-arabinose transferase-like glycosyltransferase
MGLRLRYALGTEPFVDEPTTLLVAQAIAHSGLPILPSGLFYGNDLPFSYLAGGLVALFGPNLLLLRLFSVGLSAATMGLVYLAGRRMGSAWLGLWAGLLLALDPAAITWGGRARAYALLAFLVTAAVWLFRTSLAATHDNLPEGRRLGLDGLRRLALLLVVFAAYVHPEAALLWPTLVVGAVLLRGWRWWLQPGRLADLILSGAGLAARYWLQLALAQGQIGGLATITGTRPPLEPAGDWLVRLSGVGPFFLAPHRLPWTLLALLALGCAIWTLRTRRPSRSGDGPLSRPHPRIRAIAYAETCLLLSLSLWLVPLGMVLFLGSTYQSPRYLVMLLPVFALTAAAGLHSGIDRLVGLGLPGSWRIPGSALASVALALVFLPGALTASSMPEKGFQSALEYVGQRWQPGDRLATVAPAYSQVVLGRCDYFTLGSDYEEFVYRDDGGHLVDRWLGSPLVRTAAELRTLLDEPGRTWLVVDETRLRQRFDPGFAQAVWLEMELVEKVEGVMVFATAGAPEPAASHPTDAVFGEKVSLDGYALGGEAHRPADPAWGEVVARPGESLPLTLYWRAVEPVQAEYTIFVHLLGQDGARYGQADGPALDGLQPMAHWLVGETLPDRRSLPLPSDLDPGQYRLVVGLYGRENGDRLPIRTAADRDLGDTYTVDYVRVPGPDETLPSPARTVGADLTGNGDRIRLLGYTLAAQTADPGGQVGLTLYWQALVPVQTDYTAWVHLLGANDQIRGQGDGPLVGGFFPTSYWDPGELVVDERAVAVDADAPPGSYRLVAGLYILSTGQRLSAADGDRLALDEIRIER